VKDLGKDYKFAKQLQLRFEETHIRKSKAAQQIHVAASTMSDYINGEYAVSHDSKKALASMLGGLALRWSSGRADFHIISFMDDPKLRADVFAAIVSAKKEERERLEQEQHYQELVIERPGYITRADQEFMDSYWKNAIEEVAAEITKLIRLAKYEGRDPQPLIDAFNDALGG
jgi:plasmid maintenance system antidote protein VapI